MQQMLAKNVVDSCSVIRTLQLGLEVIDSDSLALWLEIGLQESGWHLADLSILETPYDVGVINHDGDV